MPLQKVKDWEPYMRPRDQGQSPSFIVAKRGARTQHRRPCSEHEAQAGQPLPAHVLGAVQGPRVTSCDLLTSNR